MIATEKSQTTLLVTAFIILCGAFPSSAETLVLQPTRDTSIFSEASNRSNGSGVGLFAGRTAGQLGTGLRRALLHFDLSGLPAGATIESVTLSLHKQVGLSSTLSIHRLQQVWGESGSDSGLPGGQGATAQPGDATWTQNLVLTQSWITPGGAFIADSSASAIADAAGQRIEWQGGALIDDVRHWIASPHKNFGWILLGDEATSRSAQRFGSRESAEPPVLTIVYSTGAPQTLKLTLAGPGGEVTGAGVFSNGSTASITATPSPGFAFLQWFGDGVADSANASTTVLMTEDRSITAEFHPIPGIPISVTASPEFGGKVTGGGTFQQGLLVPIAAEPDAGYRFDTWRGNGITEPSKAHTTLLAEEGNSASATFVKVWPIAASANDDSLGWVTGAGTFDHGSLVTLTATPRPGARFVRWVSQSGDRFTNAELTLKAEASLTLVAQFVAQQALTILAEPATAGFVSDSLTADIGSEVPITATPEEGYRFIGWQGDGVADPKNAETTVMVTEGVQLTAMFVPVWDLDVLASDGGSVVGEGRFDDGSEIVVTAIPEDTFRFERWDGEGIADPARATTTVLMTEDRTVRAFFVPQFELSVRATPDTAGSVTEGGLFDQGARVAISAIPEAGYRFVAWEGEGISNTDTATTEITMSESRSIEAIFTRQWPLTVAVGPSVGGTVHGSGVFDHDTEAQISALPFEGYQFAGWSGADVLDPNSATSTIIMTTNRDVIAEFAIINLDADSDGLKDDWELLVGLDPDDPGDAEVDSDHDGQSNLAEFLSHTDPFDPGSVFAIKSERFDDLGNLEIAWSSEPGKTYGIETSTALSPGSWVQISQVTADAQSSNASLVIPENPVTFFVRVRALPD